MQQKIQASQPSPALEVWDRGIRAFHWLLVLAVGSSLLTGFFASRPWLVLHIVSGTLIAALLTFRVIWGICGSTYARFSSFVRSPRAVINHALALKRGAAARHLGHNPLGGAMIVALLIVLTTLIATGITAFGGTVKQGPLAPFVSFEIGTYGSQIHRLLAFGVLGLIGLHVAGVLTESLRTSENLIGAMLTGKKRPPVNAEKLPAEKVPAATAKPWLGAALWAAICAVAAPLIGYFSLQPALGVPNEPLMALYAKECGDCHAVHHPSVAPKATWSAIMRDLDNHFGENASLESDVTLRFTGYLKANAAEVWDTKAANRLRKPAKGRDALRITATKGWRSIHSDIDAQVFKAKPVSGKLNCTKCHKDAETGRFAPRAIAIPEEKKL